MAEAKKETTTTEEKKSSVGRKAKYKKIMKNAFGLAGVVYSDDIVEINVGGLSEVDKKRLERSIELGLIEKA